MFHQLHNIARDWDRHITLCWHHCVRKVNDRKVLRVLQQYEKNDFAVCLISCYLFYNAAVFITLLYWTLLYESGAPSYFNLYVHGLQASRLCYD